MLHHLIHLRRRLGLPRSPRQRALPRHPAGPGPGLAAPRPDRAHRHRAGVPRRVPPRGGRRGAERGRASTCAGPADPPTPDRAQRRRRTPRPRAGRRDPGRRPVRPSERERRTGGTVGRLRRRAAGRSPGPAHRRHQPLAAARGRGRTAGRLAGDPGQPADRAGQASHAGPVGAARRRLPGGPERQSRRPLDRLLRRSEPDAPLRRRHQPAAAQLRRRPAARGRAGVHHRGVQPRQQPARRHPGRPGSPPSRCACWTRTPCSRRRSSPSPATNRPSGSTSSSAPTAATWPPPC